MPVIIYIDMNSFFVSCHQVKNQELKDKPVVVSGDSRRAVVASASYEARKFSIRSGMPLYQAYNLCPTLVKINTDFKLYKNYSKKIFNFLAKKFSKLIEQCSIDEYCLDITDTYQSYGSTLNCAKKIQEEILKKFDLPCSIGISFNKVLAKMASKLEKPQGIAIVNHNNLKEKLYFLPIEKMNGIGPKTSIKLKTLNIYKIGDLVANTNYQALKEILGKRYLILINQAQGKTKETINLNSQKEYKSIGRDLTLEYDSNEEEILKAILKKLAHDVATNAKKRKFTGKTLVCGFKFNNKWTTKQCQLENPTNDEKTIYELSLILFDKIWKSEQLIRALRIAIKKSVN